MSRGFSQFVGVSLWWLVAILVVLLSLAVIYHKLTRMPWFRSRRLTVCIVLSVLAHVLLITVAYMSKLFELPTIAGDGAIRVTWEEVIEPQSGETSAAEVALLDVELDTPTDLASEFVADEPLDEAPVESFVIPDDPLLESGPAPAPLHLTPAPPVAHQAHASADESLTQQQPPPDDEDLFQPEETMTPPVESTAEAITGRQESQPDFAQPNTTSPAKAKIAEPQLLEVTPIQDEVDSHMASESQWRKVPTAKNDPLTQELVPVKSMWQRPSVSDRYRLRTSNNRLPEVLRRGGDANTEAAVAAAMQWLADNQDAAGRWDASRHQAGQERIVGGDFREGAGLEADTGITGLALLVFLAAGNTHQEGDFRDNVARGLEYLMSQQGDDGCLAGGALKYARTYCHGIATLALSEALAMTDDKRLRPFVERAVRYSLRGQHREFGGWRYWQGQPGDTSQFGWQVMALMSAEQAGITIPTAERRLLDRFLKTVSSGRAGGLAGYRPGHPPTRAMTAEAMVCRVFLRQKTNRPRLAEGANFLATAPPSTGPMNLYYWYYGSMALYQVGGHHWETWNEALKKRLLPRQRSQGALAGSWDPNCVWGGHGGRVYSTAMAALCLEVYYRYLPLLSQQVAHHP